MAKTKRPASPAAGGQAKASKVVAKGDVDRLSAIKLLVLDVDGVLTDGRINIDSDGRQFKSFDVRDGAGIKYWQRTGRQVAMLSGRSCPSVTFRAAELGVSVVRQNFKDKLPAYESILAELKCRPGQVAVMGDDLPDLPLMLRCGFAIAPADAAPEVKAAAALVTARPGGQGAVREAVEHILRATGQWAGLLERYYRGIR